MVAKAELARHINTIIQSRGLTQSEAAKLLGVSQPKVSALHRGRLTDFSMDRLMRFLVALGQSVNITIGPARKAGFRVVQISRRLPAA